MFKVYDINDYRFRQHPVALVCRRISRRYSNWELCRSAITSITVQNTLGIQEFFDIPAEIVSGQIEAVMNDMQPDIVKIGMIRRVETLNVVIDTLTRYRPAHIIYAPAICLVRAMR